MSEHRQNNIDVDQLEPLLRHTLERGFPWLRFPSALEAWFQQVGATARRRHFQLAGFIGLLIYNLFNITDREMLPDAYHAAWLIRIGIATPLAMLGLLSLGAPALLRHRELIASLVTLTVNLSIIVIWEQSHHPYVVFYHTGLFLAVMYGIIVTRLGFWYACAVSWISFASAAYAITRLETLPPTLMLNENVVLFAGILISLAASYLIEREQRRGFLLLALQHIDKHKLERANAELSRQSTVDGLTGLANRRHFDERMAAEWRMAQREGKPLALVFLDVDHFKLYNDHYGHQAGDVCLQRVAQCMMASVHRAHDLCARYGGEEYMALLPDTTLADALVVAERIRSEVAALQLPHADSPTAPYVTISLGVSAGLPAAYDGPQALIELADQALYRAKSGGRNRVEASNG